MQSKRSIRRVDRGAGAGANGGVGTGMIKALQAGLITVTLARPRGSHTGAIGATGKPHDWSVSAQLVKDSSRPVILAGGLTAGNVQRAIRQTGAAGVDVHTGVEGTDGRKRRDLLERFVAETTAGFAA